MTNKATGISAFERDVRERLKQADDLDAPDDANSYAPIGVLRGLIRDIEMWRRIGQREIELLGFDDLVVIAKRMLDEVYPETVFNGTSIGADVIARTIAEHVGATRSDPPTITGILLAAEAIVDLMHRNSGVRFVLLLRTLIDEIETRPEAK